jgi:hypothetical protein
VRADEMTAFLKYDSGNKAFKEISGLRELSSTTDACIIVRKKVKAVVK